MESVEGGSLSNTLKLPSIGTQVFFVRDAEDVRAALEESSRRGLQTLPLGEGSNVVLPPVLNKAVFYATDQSLSLLEEQSGHVVLRVGAAYPWHQLVLETVRREFYGLENLALIPGLIGAAPVQNIGAYGRELSEFVVAVHGVNLGDGRAMTLSAQDCEFAYRHSVFKDSLRDRFMITAVDLRLSREPAVHTEYPTLGAELAERGVDPSPAAVLDAVVAIRSRRLPDPEATPNVGSFFKNPIVSRQHAETLLLEHPTLPTYDQGDGRIKLPAAWLIEACGLRGHGGETAGVAEQHALVIVNRGGARQSQILALAQHIQQSVKEAFDVALEIEPRVYPCD